MGIRFLCPNGHKLNVKAFQAGRRGICPFCGAKFQIPTESTLQPGQVSQTDDSPADDVAPSVPEGDVESAFEQNLEAHLQQAEAQPLPSYESRTTAAWAAKPSNSDDREETLASPEEPTATEADRPENVTQPGAVPNTVEDAAPLDAQPAAVPAPVPAPSQPDPLTETPSAVWYVRPPSGGQFGPAQAEMMRGWLSEGRVSPETLVWREGWADWREATSVFPQLQSAASAMPEAPPVAMSNGDVTSSYRPGTRRRSGPNMGLIAVLVAAVVLLLLVLIWILSGGGESSPEEGNSVAASVTAEYASRMSLTT